MYSKNGIILYARKGCSIALTTYGAVEQLCRPSLMLAKTGV
jgi:hypothetical protein